LDLVQQGKTTMFLDPEREQKADLDRRLEEKERQRRKPMDEQKRITELQKEIAAKDDAIKRHAVRSRFISAGIVNPTDVDFLSMDGLVLTPSGEVVGADELVAQTKKDRPNWFNKASKKTTTTDTTAETGDEPPKTPERKDAFQMTDDEFRAEWAEYAAGRRREGGTERKPYSTAGKKDCFQMTDDEFRQAGSEFVHGQWR
jgi:hypothetical protein